MAKKPEMLQFLQDNAGVINLNALSRKIFDTDKALFNFQEMVAGKRKMKDSYVVGLFHYLNDHFNLFGGRKQTAPESEMAPGQALGPAFEKYSVSFIRTQTGVMARGMGAEFTFTGKKTELTIKGELVTDLAILEKFKQAAQAFDKVFFILK